MKFRKTYFVAYSLQSTLSCTLVTTDWLMQNHLSTVHSAESTKEGEGRICQQRKHKFPLVPISISIKELLYTYNTISVYSTQKEVPVFRDYQYSIKIRDAIHTKIP